MLAVQGPEARAHRREPHRRRAAQALPHRDADRRGRRRTCSCAAPATRARTASSCCVAPSDAAKVWDALVDAGAEPAGLGARDTLRLEVCFHLYGNDLMEDRGPIEAGLGWCVQGGHGLHRRRGDQGRPRATARREARPVRAHRPGHRPPGQRRSSAAARSRPARCSPCLNVGIGMAYVPVDKAEPGTALRDRRPRQDPHRRGPRRSPCTSKEN